MKFRRFVATILSCAVILGNFFVVTAQASSSKDGVEAFVTRMYEVCLDREPEQSGLDGWSEKLLNKEATGCSVAYGFVFSPEFIDKNPSNGDYVKYMYDAFFGREADEGGYNYWVNLLDSGSTKESVFCGFANSQEFSNLCRDYGVVRGYHIEGSDANQTAKVNLFAERLYNVILDRSCDDAGMAGWTSKLVNHEESGCSVAYGFVFSPEFINKHTCNDCFVEILYNAFLGRASDEAGKKTWVLKLKAGETRENVFCGFAGSLEFANICADYGIDVGNFEGITTVTYGEGECSICGTKSVPPADAGKTPTPGSTSGSTPGSAQGTAPGAAGSDEGKLYEGFVTIDNDLYFYENGIMQHGWVFIENPYGIYYFDDTTGKALRGWQKIDGFTYYFTDNYTAAIGFVTISGNVHYFNIIGEMQTGWVYLNDSKESYYFDPETGVMHVGWLEYKNDIYYFDSNGVMHTGWLELAGKKYYLNKAGILKTGWIYIDDATYYANDDGAVKTGWFEYVNPYNSKTEKYYFAEDGKMVTDWKKIGDDWYYFNSVGVMQTGLINYEGKYYYLNDDGVMFTGWLQDGKGWYYFTSSGARAEGWEKISNKWYFFGNNGVMQTGFIEWEDHLYYCETNGQMITGWKKIDGYWYCFDKASGGAALCNGFYKVDNKWYYFYKDCRMASDTYIEGIYIQTNGEAEGSENWTEAPKI
ncbi:MAG: DUF4214 domain-containing protein [Clostridia bacterium]|nr:DUF4214 domain-containing protein [Clostridia bacterium]